MPTEQKDTRIDLRIKKIHKILLIHAANLQNMKLSAFVLNSALKEAEDILTSKVHFALADKQWKAFCAALDHPARKIEKLKKLLTTRGVFDG
jgi:uncharacterized protein (DUF1778 family)